MSRTPDTASAEAIPRPRESAARGALADGSARYLTFMLGGELYALPILDITEIMEFRALTVVPMMPAFIRGVINLRGRVVPVVDMAARFGTGLTAVGRRTSIIIVETAGDAEGTGHDMGIMVDGVDKVVHLGADDIEPPPAFGAGIRSDFISGMAKQNGTFVIVLDVTRVLSLDEMVMLSEAEPSGRDLIAGTVGDRPGGTGSGGAGPGGTEPGGERAGASAPPPADG